LPGEQHCKGLYISDILEKKFDVLYQMDPSFKVEAAFFKMMYGSGATKLLEEKVLKVLPDKAGDHVVADVVARLDAERHNVLFKFCGAESQGAVNVVYELVQSISAGRLPTMTACKGTPFKEEVGRRLTFFAYYKKPAGSPAEVVSLSGSDAMTVLFNVVKAKIDDKKSPVTMQDLQPLHVFNWLLSQAQKDEHTKWVAAMFGNSSSSGSASSSSGGKGPRKRAATDSASKTVDKVSTGPAADGMDIFA
jgi:hypothetical protein